MGFKTFNSARRTLSGIEVMNMIWKGQMKGIERGSSIDALPRYGEGEEIGFKANILHLVMEHF
jgi:hypothetical protein